MVSDNFFPQPGMFQIAQMFPVSDEARWRRKSYLSAVDCEFEPNDYEAELTMRRSSLIEDTKSLLLRTPTKVERASIT